jgi:hypothetical protein
VRSIIGRMDDNTTKVLVIAIVLAFVFAIMRQFDRLSLHLEGLKLDILGLLKLRTGALKVTMQRHPERPSIAHAARFMHGSFAMDSVVWPGNHDIDMIIVTHPDADHCNGLLNLIQCKHYRGSNITRTARPTLYQPLV